MAQSRYAIIVAGGSGTRMGTEVPKQFLELLGKPILMWTIEVFATLEPKPSIILVLPQNQFARWKELCDKYNFATEYRLVSGGNTRFQSVKNGLSLVPADDSLVAIHDGVRPLVSTNVIEQCYLMAQEYGNAIPVAKPVETVRLADGNTTRVFPRDNVLLVQTPQIFHSSVIKKCYEMPEKPEFTDDASVAEANGVKIFTTVGNHENIKITTPADLMMAEILLKMKK